MVQHYYALKTNNCQLWSFCFIFIQKTDSTTLTSNISIPSLDTESAPIDNVSDAKNIVLNESDIYEMKQVAHGENHDCGIYTDNRAYCWGNGPYGQLGAGLQVLNSDAPVAV